MDQSMAEVAARDDVRARLIGIGLMIAACSSFAVLDSTAKLAQVLAQVEFYGLGFEYFSQYPKWIERVTKEDVLRVAKQYLNPQRYALVVVGNAAKAKLKQ